MAGPGHIAPRKWDLETLLDLVFFRWGEMAVQGQIAPKLDFVFYFRWGRSGRPRSVRPQLGGGEMAVQKVGSPP